MVGIDTEHKELVYSKTSRNEVTLNLYAINGVKPYPEYIKKYDKLFLLEIVDSESNCSVPYPFYTDDIAECAHRIIKNKVKPLARKQEADKILKRINEALNYENNA